MVVSVRAMFQYDDLIPFQCTYVRIVCDACLWGCLRFCIIILLNDNVPSVFGGIIDGKNTQAEWTCSTR